MGNIFKYTIFPPRRSGLGFLRLLAIILAGSNLLMAHQGSVCYWSLQVEPPLVRAQVRISILDLNFLPEIDANGDGILEYQEVSERRVDIQARLLPHFRIRKGESSPKIQIEDFQVLDSGELELTAIYRFEGSLSELELKSTFYELTDDQHQTFCQVSMAGEVTQFVLDVGHSVEKIKVLTGWFSVVNRVWRFLKLGLEHIFTGYDHLAFLVGLLILGKSFRSLAGIVSSFTLAHSITLILATLDLVFLPSRFVEAAIALSICYVALENMFVKEVQYRWVISFFFGLIHGFGFSNILREMQLPRNGLATSLFSFNLGVEVGQLIIILFFFPLILYLSKHSWYPMTVNLLSALMLGFGGFWFIQRLA